MLLHSNCLGWENWGVGLSERRAGAEKCELLKTTSGVVERGVGKDGGEAAGKILEVWEKPGDQRDMWKQLLGDAEGPWLIMPKTDNFEQCLSMNQHDFLLELPERSKHDKCSVEGIQVGECVG